MFFQATHSSLAPRSRILTQLLGNEAHTASAATSDNISQLVYHCITSLGWNSAFQDSVQLSVLRFFIFLPCCSPKHSNLKVSACLARHGYRNFFLTQPSVDLHIQEQESRLYIEQRSMETRIKHKNVRLGVLFIYF